MAGILAKIIQSVTAIKRGSTVPEVKASLTAGETIRAERYGMAGDDSAPLPDDMAALVRRDGAGAWFYVGSIDQDNAPTAAPGERRLYSRDADGNIVAEIWLKNTGHVHIITNDLTAIIDPSGKLSLTNSIGELITVLNDILQHLIDAKVLTAMGPQPFWAATIAALTADKVKLDSFKI